jgi:hypothetical protein
MNGPFFSTSAQISTTVGSMPYGASAFGTKFFPISTWPFSVLLRRKSITWLARLNFSSLSYEKIPALILGHYFAPQALAKRPLSFPEESYPHYPIIPSICFENMEFAQP